MTNDRTDVDQTLAEHQGCLQVLVEVEDSPLAGKRTAAGLPLSWTG